jgi:ribosomal protein L11 methylase PrmA
MIDGPAFGTGLHATTALCLEALLAELQLCTAGKSVENSLRVPPSPAPTLVRRVGRSGRLVLSGIRQSLAGDVESAYRRLGMRQVRAQVRDGWTALTFHATW